LKGTPVRLLSIGHSYVVGGNRQLAHAIRRASGGRWDVHAAAPSYFHGGKDLRPVTFAPLPDEPIPVTALPAYFTRVVHLFLYSPGALRKLLHRGWDLVHAWEEPYILAGAQIAASVPRTSRYVFRTAQSLSKWYPPPFRWFERFTVGRSSGWICSGYKVPEALLTRPGYGARPHRVIPLGVDTGVFRPDPAARVATRRSLGWDPDGPPVVGYLGRFVPEKGLRVLAAALDAVKSPWRALLVGAGPMEEELRGWGARYPDDRVRLCTSVTHEHVAPHLCAMDMLAAPSQTTPRWKEQFGRMLIEAIACGVPVVGSDSGEIPHVLSGVGEVVPEADVAAWARALGDLIDSPARRAELAARSLAARGHYSWDEVGRLHLAFFEAVLSTRRPVG
jgi:glycosyltransferase involved in cell wall biosynthesis